MKSQILKWEMKKNLFRREEKENEGGGKDFF